ncbi:MAG: HEAT repeat domain-containing protein [Simkania sp.]|nr:HEAT repeat domain-containing protein [Simkania sp.]
MRIVILFAILAASALFCDEEETELVTRVRYHLTIHDIEGAVQEAKAALEKFPESIQLRKIYLRALCEKGKETEALFLCRQLVGLSQGEQENRHLLETLAWGALHKAQYAPQLLVRINALLGSTFTNDSRAIPVLLRELRGSNAILRSVALKLAAHMGDQPLRKEILRLLKEEKVWYVRLSAIEAAGSLKMTEASSILEKIVSKDRTLTEEKGLAIVTLASLYDTISDEDLQRLVTSQRAGLRQLACQIVVQLELKGSIDALMPLLEDPSPDVRIACLSALAFLEIERKEHTKMLLNDPIPQVAITAAWLHLRQNDMEGAKVLTRYLEDASSPSRRLAAAAVASSGKKAVEVAKKYRGLSKDPFVRMNLAIGLISLREDTMLSCEVIAEELMKEQETLWMWDQSQHPVFRVLAPSRVKHIEQIHNYPTVVDSLTKMDLLGLLSILKYPKALDAVKALLKTGQAELVGSAAGTLIQEVEEEGIAALKSLLDDPEEEVRLEAALILALWGKEGSGIHVLIQAYQGASRERKIQILEALGRSGDPRAIPFLFEVLGEPFQVLRIVASSALIQCLYH